jgi:hypothetical protein
MEAERQNGRRIKGRWAKWQKDKGQMGKMAEG